MRYFLAISIVLLSGAFTMPAIAKYRAVGVGLNSCGGWTAHRRAYETPGPITQDYQKELQEVQWVFGFLSGIGWVHANDDDPLNGLDGDAVLAWMDNYCRSYPLKKIVDAATAFYYEHPH